MTEQTDTAPAPEFEGYVKFADDTVISLQCFEGRCHECPDEVPDDQDWAGPAALDGYGCEHGCGHGPAGKRKRQFTPGMCLPLHVLTTGKRLHIIMTAEGTVLDAIESEPGTAPLWVGQLAQLPVVDVTPAVYRAMKRVHQAAQ